MAVIPSPFPAGLPGSGGTLTGALSLGTNVLYAGNATITGVSSLSTVLATLATISGTASIGTIFT
jgi:hypothetical protein